MVVWTLRISHNEFSKWLRRVHVCSCARIWSSWVDRVNDAKEAEEGLLLEHWELAGGDEKLVIGGVVVV